MLLTAVTIVGLIVLMGCSVDASTYTQSDCESVVKDFTGGKSVEFVSKIGSDEKNEFRKQHYLGYYVFKDDLYTYIVDPNNLYICRIIVESIEVWTSLNVNGEKAGTEEAASQIAIDIFKKIESKFLVEGGTITTKITTPEETMYGVEIQETKDGIPTGNCASMSLSKAGNFMGGLFLIGNSQHIEKLTNEIISFEDAAQIAVDEIKSDPKLAAENIVVDETRKDEMSTRDNITVRIIYLSYDKDGIQQRAMVLVDAFSGEVIEVGTTY